MAIQNDTFSFFLPVTIVKSSDGKDDRRLIEGIASTDDLDLQGEKVLQNGIDTSYFLKHGFFNDDHQKGVENIVGEPIECRITKAGLWVKGFIYKNKERADYWWDHINSLIASGSNRKVGFSIEGKIQRREGNKITKCWLQNVAITANPVNTNTFLDVVKSLCKEQFCMHPWKSLEKACKGCPGKEAVEQLNKEKEELDQKALTAGGMGRSLVPQSLEGNAKVTTYKSLDDIISKEEAIKYLQLEKGYHKNIAEIISDYIFSEKV